MCIVIFPFGVFILSLINIKNHPDPYIFNKINESLNNIYPLSKLNYSNYCHDKTPELLYSFAGFKEGCTCVDVEEYKYDQSGKHEVEPGKCSVNKTRNGCKPVKELEGQNLYLWEKGIFCSERYKTPDSKFKGYLYFLNNSVLENETCQNGFQKCGKLDEMGNYLCIPEEKECPINDIQISNESISELEDLNYSLSIFNDKYIYHTNKHKEKAVIFNLKVAEEKLCKDKDYYYTSYPQYILDNNFEKYGCRNLINEQLYEENTDILDSRKKIDFYLDSKIDLKNHYKDWIYDFPFYSLQANMILYVERFSGYDKKCFNDNKFFDMENSPFNEKNTNEMKTILDDAMYRNSITKWLSIIAFTLILISCGALNLDSEDYIIFIWIWSLINCLFYIGMSITIYINFSKIQNYKDFPLCGNSEINTKLSIYNNTAKTIKTTSLISIIVLNLQILFNIGLIIVRYKLQYNNDIQPLKEGNKSSNIDYNKCPEEPYYNNSSNYNRDNNINNNSS